MTEIKTFSLIGGSNDKRLVNSNKIGGRWQSIIYVPSRISIEEASALMIDDDTAWKWPTDVYLYRDGYYYYDRTVHYKPRES